MPVIITKRVLIFPFRATAYSTEAFCWYTGGSFIPLPLGAELACLRTSAQRLYPLGKMRIVQIADALLRHDTLTADDVAALLDGSTEFAVLGAVT